MPSPTRFPKAVYGVGAEPDPRFTLANERTFLAWIRTALAPTVRQAIKTGLVPAIDQTRNVGIVTLPGTFVGLVLGGASPAEAARIQLTVLLTLLAVELLAATAIAELIVRTRIAPGERLREDVADVRR